jgi:hypothetical protein
VTTDFDRTITSAKSCSSHGVLEATPCLSADFTQEAKANSAKYLPMEVDPTKTIEQKLPFMREW